ncbi:aldehyde dehydrogenase [Sphingobium jiangsuense]|uniref:Acyl-CoA reductase-like NAD-dependent aldehyde dehydrogenase n=1 Tax=Sphingobium jiangsuense TaxID=870476 RepID=A0A7W6FRU2_9SPHN|nr:aldehyde dehydrogenase family protein [Sphingobium jiangsuense]MBB3928395.1 acyl-CoA reductase-like NAD-dependent aldehyde dehydrogenase [Sphingobium jiangsuense]GLS99775.1 aldehyde dehydrogenase [Sphingobium jiangsuense]
MTVAHQTVTSFIDGAFVPARGEPLAIVNPADESIAGTLHEADEAEVAAAVDGAARAFRSGPWPRMVMAERRKVFQRIIEAVRDNMDELAALETAATGQPIHYSRFIQLPRIIANFEFYAEWPAYALETATSERGRSLRYVLREPLGPVALISPSNAPTALASTKVAAALAFGNTCVVKTSENTPMALARFVQLLHEAGVPEGVVNMVNGRGQVTGDALVRHPAIKAVSFTGGTATARHIAAAAGQGLKRVDLELGGKSANIVMPSADLDKALDAALIAVFTNSGQQCFAGSRLVLHRSIAEDFLGRFAERADAIRVGHPYEEGVENGPLAHANSYRRVERMIAEAREDGCAVLAGGRRADGFDKGYYYRPTVLRAPSNDVRICQEEVFGPVAAAIVVDSLDEAIAVANGSRYGLVSYVWTNDLREAMRAAESIEAGWVHVNTPMLALDPRFPFGGYKESGVGRDGAPAARSFFTEEKTVNYAMQLPPLPQLGKV